MTIQYRNRLLAGGALIVMLAAAPVSAAESAVEAAVEADAGEGDVAEIVVLGQGQARQVQEIAAADIALEVAGTTMLQASQQFTRVWPTAGMAVCYGLAFYLLTIALKQMPVGLAYAIWSGLGVVLISIIGLFLFKQKLDVPAIVGLVMIVGGVVVINLFSKSVTH